MFPYQNFLVSILEWKKKIYKKGSTQK
ncbi:hypothetical protein CY0110_19217 [Crocosphaera chwakensis CCY0110]|uniref:Uncharacterized protein n=1 Tax=Crocosphaera chwakensis CCY0110 TaxID=391612 RepID=A3IJH5_9CHRO|nr:hypothetical protein CY0110_19217 [Crocosphaera chwakensis CCY0110]